jgi:hypothetical protein
VCNNANVAGEYHQRARQIQDLAHGLQQAEEELELLGKQIAVRGGAGGMA